ncbi:hypothetical protein ANCDUO_23206 [Ancylostoma duodenale]|uniref:UDP-glucose--hexose-1-phosphate uridylyltransferase n=1 Tax=Ancylostoma duodenale TaxID=51022 RepID=A0A0C2CA84_9BILA|nr:hypothetical protein ANCDUO_23206 [Ancylostoma duodenale]
MAFLQVTKVVKVWIQQFQELKERYIWIQIFENRGAAVGCSNAHPHGQLWAGDFLPNLPSRKDKCQRVSSCLAQRMSAGSSEIDEF